MAPAALQDGIVRRASLVDPMVALRYANDRVLISSKTPILTASCETFCAGLRSYT